MSESLNDDNDKNGKNDKDRPYKFVVRLPVVMRDRIADAAAMYRRSMNSEIVARLEQSFSVIPTDASEKPLEPPMHAEIEALFRGELSEEETQLVRTFRRMSPAQRDALLHLLK